MYDEIEKIRYETKQEICERVTATRIALLGVYAFAFKKKEIQNQKYISIELNEQGSVKGAVTFVLSGDNIEQLYIRLSEFCESYKASVLKIETQSEEQKSEVPQDYIQELKKLKELVDLGIISEEEFDMKKKQLLKI